MDIDAPGSSSMDGGGRLVSGLLTVGGSSNLLVTGAAGSGKTAIFRALRGLWPIAAGRVLPSSAAAADQQLLLYVPQRPYLKPACTLQDQLTFPLQLPEGAVPQHDCLAILETVGLQMDSADGNFAGDVDWRALLSESDTKRIGVARVIYHRPKVVVIDGATNKLGAHFDRALLDQCESLGTAVIWVATVRPSKMHGCFSSSLTLSGDDGSWQLLQESKGLARHTLQAPALAHSSVLIDSENGEETVVAAVTDDEVLQASPRVRATRPLPTAGILRLRMILRVLVPRISFGHFGLRQILLTVVAMSVALVLTTRIMTELPGQLQALAMQNKPTAYLRLTLQGLVIRSVSMGLDMFLIWITTHCRYIGSSG